MSSQRGSGPTRQRAQKHKNSFAFKNNLHDKTPQMKKTNALNVCEVCERCREQIQWKIKYKKYKPLSQAKTCVKCGGRTVTKAYHVCCKECAKSLRCCAKCLTSGETVQIEPAEPTPQEELQLKVEMDRLVKTLSERKRRTFLRFMQKGKESAPETTEQNEKDGVETTEKRRKFVPHIREDLLNKIEALKLAEDNEDDDEDFSFDESDYGSDDFDDGSDDEE